jgi:hypothetical protein
MMMITVLYLGNLASRVVASSSVVAMVISSVFG